MTIHDNATAVMGRHREIEQAHPNGMPKAAQTIIVAVDTFADGFCGYDPTHFSGSVPQNGLFLASHPVNGLGLATGSVYHPRTQQVAAYKRLTSTLNTALSTFSGKTGIISVSCEYAIMCETDARQWSAFGPEFDIQNYDSSFRAHPAWKWASQGIGVSSSPQLKIADDSQSMHNITNIANPITGSTVSTTAGLLAGENQNKANLNYIRCSFDLGNLMIANGSQNNPATGAPWVDADITARYHSVNINGFPFDLRTTQTTNPPGRGKQSPQTGGGAAVLGSFGGGLNVGFTLSQDPAATGAASLFVNSVVVTYSVQDWLS